MRVPGVPFVQGRNDYSDADGTKYGIAIHNTSNDAPAAGEASYATRRTDGISAHFYVDDREVIQSIDTKHRTGHAGSRNGNENAVSVEITGTNSKSRQWWLDNVAWDKLAHTLAVVCEHYNIQPRRASVAEMKANPKVRAFYSHDDMRRAWGGTTHTDPGGNFPWDHLLAKVRQAMTGDQEDDMTPQDLLNAKIRNPITGKDATVGTFLVSMNSEAYKARLTAEAALAAVKGVDDEGIKALIAQTATADAARDAELPARIREALPAGDGPVSREDLEAALRTVLGSVDNAPQG